MDRNEYVSTVEKIRQISNNLKHNIIQLMIMQGIESGYKSKKEFKAHFNELVSESNKKHIFKDEVVDDYLLDSFLDDAFYYVCNVPNYIGGDVKIGTTTFITGNDGDLQYYHECDVCHSVIIVDHGDYSYNDPIVCTHCHPKAKSSHRIIEVGTEDWEKGQKWFAHEKRMNTDKAYRNWHDFKYKVWLKWYDLTKFLRPAYWMARKKYNETHGKKKLKAYEAAKNLLIDRE